MAAGKLHSIRVSPPLISMYEPGGARDSDINLKRSNHFGEPEESSRLVNSTRRALGMWVLPAGYSDDW
jgi:hypothetical protein